MYSDTRHTFCTLASWFVKSQVWFTVPCCIILAFMHHPTLVLTFRWGIGSFFFFAGGVCVSAHNHISVTNRTWGIQLIKAASSNFWVLALQTQNDIRMLLWASYACVFNWTSAICGISNVNWNVECLIHKDNTQLEIILEKGDNEPATSNSLS